MPGVSDDGRRRERRHKAMMEKAAAQRARGL
jgi:hypothetical protein